MDITKLTGEELAEALNQAYNQLAMAQTNIAVINAELKRRKEIPAEEIKDLEDKADGK